MKKIILTILITITILNSSWIQINIENDEYLKSINKWKKSDQEKANEYNEKNLKRYKEEIRIQERDNKKEDERKKRNSSIELDSAKYIKGKIKSYTNINDSKTIIKVNNNRILIETYDMDNILESNINKIEAICTEKKEINNSLTFINCDLTLIYN